MPGIHLYSSNSLETLAGAFADIVQSDPLPPFKKETILIQSRGMARWLAMQTASRLNIWANCHCPFPNTFIREIYRLLLKDFSDSSFYNKDSVAWYLMAIIPELRTIPYFHKLDTYLETDNDLKLYQLAFELADLFDQYTLYRPQMILAWENNEENTITNEHLWQSLLWQKLGDRFYKDLGLTGMHRAGLLQMFEEKLLDPLFDATILPARISVFGITSLPPYHLRVLNGLSHHVDLHLFMMNPCMEYWFDIIADRDIVKISRKEESTQELLHLTQGNRLLSSMGHLGRDFMLMLQDLQTKDYDLFKDPGSETLLACIQQDILFLRDNENLSPKNLYPKKQIEQADNSIRFHSCHSPMREVETLYDQLLDIFDSQDRDDPVTPRDILVMAPEIDPYAPLIRAVFDAESSYEKKIPYNISDQSIRKTSRFIETFFDILNMSNSRFTSIDVFEILENELVKNRFSISDNGLETIKTWIDKTNICWSIDQHHKTRLQLPAYNENTWQAGLDRLLLGYAMPGNDNSLFQNILPYDNIEGNDTYLLGNFLDFTENLFGLVAILQESHSLAEWSEILVHTKEKFFLADAKAEFEDRVLLQVLYGLKDIQDQTSFTQPVSIDVIRFFLLNTVDQKFSTLAGEAGFLTGGVTFCSMLPMRAIPFKVICLLGMNDGQYPRSGRKRSFDLISHAPKRGDRSRRYDDRYLFLETILSARKRLVISFVGQSIQDNNSKPPSVLVNELMDYIDQGYCLKNSKDDLDSLIIENLTVMHHLQPFHPDYFRAQADGLNEKLFSYSADNCAAAEALSSHQQKSEPPISSALPEPADEFRKLNYNDLIKFFSHPAKYLIVKRIGTWPVEENKILKTSEPFQITGLQRYKLENDILKQLIDQEDCDKLFEIKKAAGQLPHGKLGEIHFGQLVSEVQKFKVKLDELLAGKIDLQLDVNLRHGDFTVTGIIENLYENGLLRWRYAIIKPKDIIGAWISHLIINSMPNCPIKNSQPVTFLVGKKDILKYSSPADSAKHLKDLLDIYWQGLLEPLIFFPQTSFMYANEIHKGRSHRQAMLKASTEWEGNNYNKAGEKNDPYNTLCFRNIDLDDTNFAETSIRIFKPILEHQSKNN